MEFRTAASARIPLATLSEGVSVRPESKPLTEEQVTRVHKPMDTKVQLGQVKKALDDATASAQSWDIYAQLHAQPVERQGNLFNNILRYLESLEQPAPQIETKA